MSGSASAGPATGGTPPVGNADPYAIRRKTFSEGTKRTLNACNHADFAAKSLVEVKNLSKMLEQDLAGFRNEHLQLLQHSRLSDQGFVAQNGIFAAKMEMYMQARNELDEGIVQLTPPQALADQAPIRVDFALGIQTVKNTWGQFDGDFFQWQSFKDKFVAQVHGNAGVEPAYKLAHLMDSLEGEARGVVGTRPPTANGYQAVLRLKKSLVFRV